MSEPQIKRFQRPNYRFSDIRQNRSSRKRNGFPLRFIIIAVLFVMVGFSIFIMIKKNIGTSNGESEDKRETVRVEIVSYYIALTGHKNITNNISLDDLKQSSIATIEKEQGHVKSLVGVEQITSINDDDIYTWYKESDFQGIVVVPIEYADMRLKTLRIDDVSVWDVGKEMQEYPLILRETKDVAVSELETVHNTNFIPANVVTYVAGGEVIPARAVARKFRRTGDYTFPFYNVKSLFSEADFSSILLENSISGRPEPCHGCTWFIGDEQFIEGLTYLGVDYVATSGNHIGDGKISAIKRTIEVLDEAKIAHTGASEINQADASKPAVVEIDNFKAVFLSYDDVAYYHWAGENYGGVAGISSRNTDGTKTILSNKIIHDVEEAKKLGDYVILIISWGDREYINWPLENQKQIAHEFIDAGVDLIVGTHQHWVGSIEFYKNKPIFYGLGNFVFDQTHTDPTRQGAFIKFYYYDNTLVNFAIIPHESCGPQQSAVDNESCNHFRPYFVQEGSETYDTIISRMTEYSEI